MEAFAVDEPYFVTLAAGIQSSDNCAEKFPDTGG